MEVQLSVRDVRVSRSSFLLLDIKKPRREGGVCLDAGGSKAAFLRGSLTAVNSQAAEEPWSTRGPAPEALTAPKAAAAPLHLRDEASFGFGGSGGGRVQGKGLRWKSTKCERGCDGRQRQEAFHEQELRVLVSFLEHRRVGK